jgi:carbon-monoxide dehydrogenase large subunit
VIGQPRTRLGAEGLLTGSGRFVGDVRLPGMAEAAVLRSPHAHARIVGIDTRAALAIPGVLAVLTAADIPEAAVIPNRVPAPEGTATFLQPAMARGVARYAGEPVALVVAESRYLAEDALERIAVEYEPLPAVTSAEAALAAGAPRLFSASASNNVALIQMRVGDADGGLRGAALVVSERFHHARQTAAAVETRGLVAAPPGVTGGEMHLIGSTKCIHINRNILAPIFGMPPGALRLTEVDVGGGFGVRGELYPEDILVPLASLKINRPVRWVESRRENLTAANHAREVTYDLEIGFEAAGRIRAMRVVIHADIGAYVRTAALLPAEFGAALLPGPYRVPHYACDLWNVVTNKTPVGTLRSPGRPECNFARERLMDVAAARLGLDPAEIRRRNLLGAADMPYDCGTVSFGVPTVYDSGDFPALFASLLERLGYDAARAEQRALAARGIRRGIGLAMYVEKTGLGPFETARVEARPDGRFTVDTGASSMGPGLETALAQILGSALGLPAGRFDVRHPDTAAVESGVGTYGSRATVTAGNAAHMAGDKLISEARRRAAAALGVAEDAVRYEAGRLSADGRSLTLGELASRQSLAVDASFKVPKVTYAGCGVAVIADVEAETGLVTVRRVVVGADVGRAVNPRLVEDQLVGGVAFGIGNAMHESLRYDGAGQLLTGSLLDYALPSAADMPAIDAFFQEVPARTNPLGLRGVGECGNPGLGAAIANAVCDALRDLGVELSEIPITPAVVRAAVESAGSGAAAKQP